MRACPISSQACVLSLPRFPIPLRSARLLCNSLLGRLTNAINNSQPNQHGPQTAIAYMSSFQSDNELTTTGDHVWAAKSSCQAQVKALPHISGVQRTRNTHLGNELLSSSLVVCGKVPKRQVGSRSGMMISVHKVRG